MTFQLTHHKRCRHHSLLVNIIRSPTHHIFRLLQTVTHMRHHTITVTRRGVHITVNVTTRTIRRGRGLQIVGHQLIRTTGLLQFYNRLLRMATPNQHQFSIHQRTTTRPRTIGSRQFSGPHTFSVNMVRINRMRRIRQFTNTINRIRHSVRRTKVNTRNRTQANRVTITRALYMFMLTTRTRMHPNTIFASVRPNTVRHHTKRFTIRQVIILNHQTTITRRTTIGRRATMNTSRYQTQFQLTRRITRNRITAIRCHIPSRLTLV